MGRTARAGRPKEQSIEVEIARLSGLDLKSLRVRWHGLFRKAAPANLPKHLLFGLIAYRLQADVFGDLNSATRKTLDSSAVSISAPNAIAKLQVFDRQQAQPSTGSIMIREWNGKQYKVMAMKGGFAWNGKIYKSLSQIAFAITGTKWNGPRFFGLRDAASLEKMTEAKR